MKKTKILSLLLCLSLFCALIVPGTRAYADNAPGSGMKISKTATANDDGSYTITLEAYATGEKVISEITKDVPTDIILVLDQSGSMAYDIGQVQYTPYTGKNTQNKKNYEKRHNGGSANLWHKLPNGSFVSVSVTLQQTITYKKITNGRNDSSYRGYTNYWENRNNLYTYVNGEIKKVVYTRERDWFGENWNCKYALEDGTILNENNEGSRHSPTFQNTDDGYLYLAVVDEKQNVYTYTYTDANGTTQTIDTSTGASTRYTPAFYQRSTTTSGGGSRLNALKSAANAFASAVATKAAGADGELGTDDDVNHRIAVVGYASRDDSNDPWINTELFIGANQHNYNVDAKDYYNQAFQNMNTPQGQSNIQDSIGELGADGATYTDYGMEMANGILDAYPLTNNEQRNRVIILFTDGFPGRKTSDFNTEAAKTAISHANTAKGKGTTVYTVGIFSGADATSAGNMDGDNTQKANWFMQQVSSNNGTPQSPSYYLSAGDSASLNNIFQQISSNIETGGTSSTLTADAVVKDIISPQFTLPANATADSITLETYQCTGKNSNNEYTWSKNETAMDAEATVNGDQVSVTGFDFAEHYVGTVTENGSVTYRGHKLVISFKVQPKAGFLGGNDVVTNASAGIYENGSAQTPVMTFEQPQVDVTIKKPDITLPDANVYLGAYFSETVNADDLKAGTSIKFGDNIVLDLTKPDQNWGLEDWQTEYVTIEVKVTDKDGNEVTNFEKLTEDTEYKVSVSIKPKTPKEGNSGYDESMAGKIHVFKPELTFKDSTAYYGDTAPSDLSGNLTNTEWKHGETKSTDSGVTMIGTAPTLDLTYTPEAGKIAGGKINTKEDISVDVSVKIGTADVTDETSFVHTKCDETCTDPANGKFWIHVKTCTLNITKQGGAADESYVFDVFNKDGVKYSEVTVWGNSTETLVELPIGTYTIRENAGWSWRYSANNGGSAALTAQNPTGSITCTNSSNGKIYWLNGFSQVVRNIFGISH